MVVRGGESIGKGHELWKEGVRVQVKYVGREAYSRVVSQSSGD